MIYPLYCLFALRHAARCRLILNGSGSGHKVMQQSISQLSPLRTTMKKTSSVIALATLALFLTACGEKKPAQAPAAPRRPQQPPPPLHNRLLRLPPLLPKHRLQVLRQPPLQTLGRLFSARPAPCAMPLV